MMHLRSLGIAICIAFLDLTVLSTQCLAQSSVVRVLVADWPPLAYVDQNNRLTGTFVDRVRATAKSAGLSVSFEKTSFATMFERAKSEPVLIGPASRTAERDAVFDWLGLIATDETCFVTRAGTGNVDSLEAAAGLSRVGVNPGGALLAELRDAKFQNLDVSAMIEDNPRKLNAGRFPAWYSTRMTFPFVTRGAGLDPSAFTCGASISKKNYWVAASRFLDPAILHRLQIAFAHGRVPSIEAIVAENDVNYPKRVRDYELNGDTSPK